MFVSDFAVVTVQRIEPDIQTTMGIPNKGDSKHRESKTRHTVRKNSYFSTDIVLYITWTSKS